MSTGVYVQLVQSLSALAARAPTWRAQTSVLEEGLGAPRTRYGVAQSVV